jgi:hypothetical protein
MSDDGAEICDGDGAEGRPGRVEEERLRLGHGRPGRRRLTPGRTAGEGSGEREAGGGRRLRSNGKQRDALGLVPIRHGLGKGSGGGVLDISGTGNRLLEVEAVTKFRIRLFFFYLLLINLIEFY